MTRETLFRESSQRSGADDWIGQVRVIPPLAHGIWAVGALALTVAIVAWLALGSYTRRERVEGHLVPQTGSFIVRSRGYGDATQVLVNVGDIVEKGQPLVRYSNDQYLEDSQGTSEKGVHYVREQIALTLKQQRNAEEEVIRARQSLREQIGYARMQLRSAEDEVDLYDAEARELAALADGFDSVVESGYISKVQLQQHRSNAATARTAALRKRGEISQMQRQISEMEGALAKIDTDAASQKADRSSRLAELELQILSKSSDAGGTILSPREGVVTRLNVVPGQSLSPGSAVVSLMQRGSAMEAELVVPSSAIGFVRPGTRVFLRYSAFPFQKYGVHEAKVREISPFPLSQAEAAELLGNPAVQHGGYKVKATLQAQRPVDGRTLLPGMSLEADLLQEKRRLYQWVVEPVAALRNGMKEVEVQK